MNHEKLQPLVSVIVPVYNVEKYLTRCLDSIVEQTYQKLEILLINDGSTDDSGKICHQYAERDSRIRLFHQENRGQSAARNVGLDNMTGEYIVFVDSDDYISTRFVEVLLNVQQKSKAPIVSSNYFRVSEEDDEAEFQAAALDNQIPYKILSRDDVFCVSGRKKVKLQEVIVSKLYKKTIFGDMRFPVGKIYEDSFLFPKIFWRADTILYLDFDLYAYRMSPNSTMRRDGITTYRPNVSDIYLDCLAFARQHGLDNYAKKKIKKLANCICRIDWAIDLKERKEYLKNLEHSVYQISGKRLFSWKYLWFKLSPGTFQFTRKYYLKVKAFLYSRALTRAK